jgi:hypothetical protein
MHSQQIIWALALLCLVVWVTYNLTCPFGWLSPLKVSHCYLGYHNGARYEIRLVKWRRKMVKNITILIGEISKNNYAFARELDMITLVEEMDLPSGLSIYSRLPDGRVLVIDTFHQRKDHIRRTTDFVCMGSYDVYAIVSQEIVDVHEPVLGDFINLRKTTTVA